MTPIDGSTPTSCPPYDGLLKVARNAAESPLGTIVLVHGFALGPAAYTALVDGLHGDGWTVYAPELYSICTAVGYEVDPLAACCRWAHATFRGKLLLAGHSRGAQVALMHLLHDTRAALRGGTLRGPPLSAYAGLLLLDPVEGRPGPLGCGMRHVLLGEGRQWQWCADIPVLTVAAEYSCAPPGHGARDVFAALLDFAVVGAEEQSTPFYLCEAPRVGHMDFVDERTGLVAFIADAFLQGSRQRRPELRRLTCDSASAAFTGNGEDVRTRLARVQRRFAADLSRQLTNSERI